ncbi:MAG: hypothetical protein ACPKOI_01755 [Pleomorphochaeta sp.]
MNTFSLILPFLLFGLTILINIIVINYKVSENNKNNNAQKRLIERVRKAEQSLNEKLITSEEKINSQKIEMKTLFQAIDDKIKELQSYSQELAKLTNTLNEYRSMLAVLEVSTNKTHEWVITVRNDCAKLQELEQLINEHQKATLQIIDSYDEATKKQNAYYGEYESKLEDLKNNYFSEIENNIKLVEDNLNSKVVLINQASNKLVENINSAQTIINNIEKKHNDFLVDVETDFKNLDEKKEASIVDLKNKINEDTAAGFNQLKSKIDNLTVEKSSQYINNLQILNEKKMEEVENSLAKAFESINQIKAQSNTMVENVVEKDKNKNSAKENSSKEDKTEEIKLVEKEKKVANKKVNKELDSKEDLDNEDKKKYMVVGEEEEIEID